MSGAGQARNITDLSKSNFDQNKKNIEALLKRMEFKYFKVSYGAHPSSDFPGVEISFEGYERFDHTEIANILEALYKDGFCSFGPLYIARYNRYLGFHDESLNYFGAFTIDDEGFEIFDHDDNSYQSANEVRDDASEQEDPIGESLQEIYESMFPTGPVALAMGPDYDPEAFVISADKTYVPHSEFYHL